MEFLVFVAGALSGLGIAAISLFTAGKPLIERFIGQAVRRDLEQMSVLLKNQFENLENAKGLTKFAPSRLHRLQEKQGEVIAETYARLAMIQGYLYELAGLHRCATDESFKENRGALVDEYRKLSSTLEETIADSSRYIQRHGIYFAGPLSAQLASVQAIFLKARTSHWQKQKSAPSAALVSFEQTPKELEATLKLLEQHFNSLLLEGPTAP